MQQTVRLTTGQALIRFLAAQHTERDGVRRRLIAGVFGILGHGNAGGLGQALSEAGDMMPFLQGKHEQSMVHAAIGYAKEQDRLSTLAVTTSIGPGAANLVTGAGTATVNRIPVLLLPGDVFARRRQGPVLQQVEQLGAYDITTNDALRPVSRYFDRIWRPEQLIESLPRVVAALLEPGDAGAVTLALCQDVQAEAFDWPAGLFDERVHKAYRQPPAQDAVTEAASRIAASRRPLIIAGGGVRYSGAEQSLRELSDTMGAPVAETYAGRGTARECELVSGGVGIIGSSAANTLAGEADLVVAIGTRLADTVTASHSIFKDPDLSFVSVNVSKVDLVKNYALAVEGDARAVIDELTAELKQLSWRTEPAWRQRVDSVLSEWKSTLAAELEKPQDPMRGYEVIHELNSFATADDRVVVASSTAMGYTHSMWDSPAKLDLEYGYSCMGYEIPASLGHRLARDEGDCYTVLGDGTYLMGYPGEFVTAIQERKRFTAIVLVNKGWQCINSFELNAIGRTFGTQFKMKTENGEYAGDTVEIDYAANAAALGCQTFNVRTREELRDALASTRAGDRPFLIAAHVVDDPLEVPPGAWWDFGSPEMGGSPDVAERHAQHLEAGQSQRWYV